MGVRPHWENFGEAWTIIDFPRLLFNTAAAGADRRQLGTLLSCVTVAYGFSRFRFRGRNFLFLMLLSTIFLPAAVTLIPTYTIFVKLGWVGTWLPLLVPAFFANAYDVFLLRQYFMTLPRELDDAAKIDGAGPLRILTSVIIPQSWAVIMAVAVFHIVYTWNLYFEPLLYLSSKPDLQPIATGLAQFNSIYSEQVELVQAATLMTIVIPMVDLLHGPAVLHARHRHHRGREVSDGPRVALTFDAEHPDRPHHGIHAGWVLDELDGSRCAHRSSSRADGWRRSPRWPGAWRLRAISSATIRSITRGCRSSARTASRRMSARPSGSSPR